MRNLADGAAADERLFVSVFSNSLLAFELRRGVMVLEGLGLLLLHLEMLARRQLFCHLRGLKSGFASTTSILLPSEDSAGATASNKVCICCADKVHGALLGHGRGGLYQ